VAGIITAVRQTPLSHVNLRAVQDQAPNAFILKAAENPRIKPLIGKYVYYRVSADGFEVREATTAEVDAHFAALRPAEKQVPKRDLTVTEIKRLEAIAFGDSPAFGVKTANLAAMRSFGLPDGTVPDGFGIPFHFYDAFMKHNGFYQKAESILADPEVQKDRGKLETELARFRELLRGGRFPDSLMAALAGLQGSFPQDASIRCRSSTNSEDLPGFSGAGLYDSVTHHPTEGHLAKSVQEVFASVWNFRAFEEREFYRIDHLATAMGVLVHVNFTDEKANGVAVTDDILYGTHGNYYLNAQVGEDLVTNPEDQSIPEEILLGWWSADGHEVRQYSNRKKGEERVLRNEDLSQLRKCLAKIHARFAGLYGIAPDLPGFAMEIEYKITREGALGIKQARPWVFAGLKKRP
jgi:phosphoenolpyruvate synthase/pyruvate phosphate dikinase